MEENKGLELSGKKIEEEQMDDAVGGKGAKKVKVKIGESDLSGKKIEEEQMGDVIGGIDDRDRGKTVLGGRRGK